eukprot:TRINITY_DN61774_c0_g1_i1.p1 TRINITY_DN61774_c0_g1~~TRINITY_DN61774_c0_g1_i1.p1  ORF type:complete len:1065 (+),score=132.52 TRINITY_DN61774_c0_g1_i1:158-3352(+)
MVLMLGALAGFLGVVLSRGRDVADLASSVFGSFVAVTGDAHQAKVAQDIFRQQVRYERSLQIREDMRDVNKMMMESVQTHVIFGSIILGVCFNMAIEGYPPWESDRTVIGLWIVFTCWSCTFTLLALWLALRFQMKMSSSARERLLRRHRLMVPDDLVVGRMGGRNVVNQVANFHNWLLGGINSAMADTPSKTEEEVIKVKPMWWKRHATSVRVESPAVVGSTLDVEPLRKGMYGWLHQEGKGWSNHTLLDVPFFLAGETLVRSPWEITAAQARDNPLAIRVYGEATLYIAAQCPPKGIVGDGMDQSTKNAMKSALRLDMQVPEWPQDELPEAVTGFHEDWQNERGRGEFRRVDGFSMYVDRNDIELPLYKLVLASPKNCDFVDVVLHWRFKIGCEALVVVLRQGHIHCKEEDWPLAEFNAEVKDTLNLRSYSGLYLRYGTSCMILSACILYLARMSDLLGGALHWWYEVCIFVIGLSPSLVALQMLRADLWDSHSMSEDSINRAAPIDRTSIPTQGGIIETAGKSSVAAEAAKAEAALMSVEKSNEPPLRQQGTPQVGDQPAETALQGPSRVLMQPVDNREQQQGSVALPGVESRTAGRARLEPASGLCSNVQFGLQSCQVLAVDRSQADSAHRPVRAQETLDASPIWPPPSSMSSGGQAGLPGASGVFASGHSAERNTSDALWSAEVAARAVPASGIPGIKIDSKQDPEHLQRRRENCFRRLFNIPKSGRGLYFGTRLLEALCSLSAAFVILASPSFFGFLEPLVGTANVTIATELHALRWSSWSIVWPPLFRPTALLVERDQQDEVLHIAAGTLLCTFRASRRGWMAVGEPQLLPSSASGLARWGGELAVFGVDALYRLPNFTVPSSLPASLASKGPMDLLSIPAKNLINFEAIELPPGLGLASAGAIAEVIVASGQAVSAALLTRSGVAGVSLYRATKAGHGSVNSSGRLEFVAQLDPLAMPSGEVRGLHVCPAIICADEAVLWITSDAGVLIAVGLNTGKTFGRYKPPTIAQTSLRGSSGSSDSANIVAISGNATHLVVVAARAGHALVYSAPYPPYLV